MRYIPRQVLTTAIIVFYSIAGQAQGTIHKYEWGAAISSFIYQGDLTPARLGSYRTMRWGINLFANRILGPSFSLRASLFIGGLRGDDARYNLPEWRKERSFNFRTPLLELAPMLVWDPMRRNYADRGFSTYFLAGAGFTFLRIKRDWSNFNAAYFGETAGLPAGLTQDIDHGLPKIIPVIPLGIGFRYQVTPQLAVSAESVYRLSYTDYLDGFSKAANPDRNDHYQTISIGAVYRKGKKNNTDCPVLRY
jgi:hypothetical protein